MDPKTERCPTGISGLDEVLEGGLVPRRAYLVRGGLPAARIASRGAGETEPATAPGDCRGNAATPMQIACLQPDRRVEVQVDGMRQDGP